MKTIIAGTRTVTDADVVISAIQSAPWVITHVVTGGAPGVDFIGECWAKENGIPLTVCPAEWEKYGKSAGPLRNVEMADMADALVAIWDGDSRGTANMISVAAELGLQVHVVRV